MPETWYYYDRIVHFFFERCVIRARRFVKAPFIFGTFGPFGIAIGLVVRAAPAHCSRVTCVPDLFQHIDIILDIILDMILDIILVLAWRRNGRVAPPNLCLDEM